MHSVHTKVPVFVNVMYFCHSKMVIRIETVCKTELVERRVRVVAHMLAPGCFSSGTWHSHPTDSMSETCLNSQMSFNEASPYERFIQSMLADELDTVNSISELLLGLYIRCVFNTDNN